MRLGHIDSLCVLDFEMGQCGSEGKGCLRTRLCGPPSFFPGSLSLSASSSFLHFPPLMISDSLVTWYLLPLTQRVCQGLQCVSPPLTQDQVCGLCGNFDGVQNNDFTSSSLQVEEDPVDFGNSWKVSSQCADTRKVHPGSQRMEGSPSLMAAMVGRNCRQWQSWALGLSPSNKAA